MGVIKTQSIRGTIAAYLGVLVGMFNLLWLQPKLLTSEEVGLLGVLVDAAVLFMPFVLLGATAVFIRFYPQVKQTEREESFVGLMFLLPTLGLVLFAGFFFLFRPAIVSLFADKSPLFAEYVSWVVPICAFMVYYAILESYGRVVQRTAVVAFIHDVGLRVLTAGLIVAYFLGGFHRNVLVTLYALIFAAVALTLIVYFRQAGGLRLSRRWAWVTPPVGREMMRYAMFVFLGSMSTTLVGKIDSLMIANQISLTDNAIYRIAYFMGLVIEMPRRALSQIAGPMVAQAITHNDMATLEQLYKKISINQFIIGLLLFIGIWVNIDSVFAIMPNGAVYSAGKYVVLFIGIGKLFDMVTSINEDIIAYSRYYPYALFIMGGLIFVTIITNLLLIPPFGIVGSAIATALSLLLYNVGKYLLIYTKFHIQPFTFATLKVLLIALAVLLLNTLLPTQQNVFLDLMLRSLLVGSVFVGLNYAFRTSEDLNGLVEEWWKKVF